jgi:DNA recombination protein RmuC
MGNALLVIVILGLAAVIALVLMVYKHLQRPSRDQQALSMLQQQMDALRRDTTDAIDKNTRTLGQQSTDITFQLTQRLNALDQGMRDVTGQVNTRLDNALRVIRDVSATMGQLSSATEQMCAIGKDISSLQNILRAPKLRGLIGELFLGNLLEQIVPGCYELQHRFASGEAVDAVIRLSHKLVPVDAKFPLENFQRLAAVTTDAERQVLRRKFLSDVKKHIDAVSRKYILPDEGTFDFALMYIPAENVYYETVIRAEPEEESLAGYAVEHRVIPVSPASLYAYLQAIVFGLRGMQIEQRAREILDHLDRLRVEFARFRDDFDLLGTHLTHARNKYDEASRRMAQLEGKLEVSHEATLQSEPARKTLPGGN